MVASAFGRTLRRLSRVSRPSFRAIGGSRELVECGEKNAGCSSRRRGLGETWTRGSIVTRGNCEFSYQSVRFMCTDIDHEDGTKPHEAKKQKEKEEDDEKRRVLNASLTYVPSLGWTEAAIAAGARDVNLSPAILGAFHRKEAALVEYFMDESLNELVDTVEEQKEELDKLVLRERLAKIMRIRLEMQAPYVSKWAQALSIQANPINLPVAMKQRAVLMDEIWHAAGDRSTDWDFYSKRAILGGVYTATEVYMLTDYSPGFRDTWGFMERRIIDAIDSRKTAKEASQLAQAIGAGLGNTIASFLKQPRSGPLF